jgi:hypothetical protein
MMKKFITIPVFIAIVMLYFGLPSFVDLSAIAHHGVRAEADVISIYAGPGWRMARPPRIILGLSGPDGKGEGVDLLMNPLWIGVKEGDSFPVLYEASDPENIVPSSRFKFQMCVSYALMLGGLSILLAKALTGRPVEKH